MSRKFEVAIVGAGPAGISAACILAENGVDTLVLERGEFPGAKNISGGVLYGNDLARILPDFEQRKAPIERNIIDSRIWYLSDHGGYSLSYKDEVFEEERKYNVFTVGRARFDRWFARQAEEKGAVIVSSTVVEDLIRDGSGRVCGVKTDRPNGDVEADVVLLADGINSPLAAKTGFRPDNEPEQIALGVKEIIELPRETINERFNVSESDGVTIEVLGSVTGGMNGVGALYTNKDSLSLVIGANVAHFRESKIRPYDLIEDFKKHPMVANLIQGGTSKEYMAHWLPEGGFKHIPKLYGDGYLIAGDSGMLFNALHREGSNMAMISGKTAAETILEAKKAGYYRENTLSAYMDKLWNSFVLKDMKKYKNFPDFMQNHSEIFNNLPDLGGYAAREMLSVDSVPKKNKQQAIWKEIKSGMSRWKMFKLAWDAWRSVK